MFKFKFPVPQTRSNRFFVTGSGKRSTRQPGVSPPIWSILKIMTILTPLTVGIGNLQAQTQNPDPAAPGTVTGLISPSGSIDAGAAPSFNWTPVENGAKYRVFVVDVISGTPKTFSAWLSAASLKCASGGICSYSPSLIYSGLVKWRVQARNSEGKSAWSDAEFFYGETPVPDQVATISPDGTITTNLPEYQWEADIMADQYRLAVVDSDTRLPIFNQLYSASEAACLEGTGICSVTPSIPVRGNIRWWVQPRNASGKAPWSVRRNFNVATPQ